MKKSSKILLSLVVVIAALAVTYRMVNRAPSPDLPVHEQLLQVLEDGGCADCHTAIRNCRSMPLCLWQRD